MVFYVDEADCLGTLPTATFPIQPVFAIAGIILRRECLQDFTLDWLNLKERFFPNLRPAAADFLDWIMVEIKGSELRKSIRQGPRDPRRHALGFIDKFLGLLERHNARLLGRIYVKPIGPIFNGRVSFPRQALLLLNDSWNLPADFHRNCRRVENCYWRIRIHLLVLRGLFARER